MLKNTRTSRSIALLSLFALSSSLSASWRSPLQYIQPVLQSKWTKATAVAAAIYSVWPAQAYTRWLWTGLDQVALPGDPRSLVPIEKTITDWQSYEQPGNRHPDRPFLFGVSSSSIQVDNGHTPQTGAWGAWVEQRIQQGFTDRQLPGITCDAQTHYKQDVQLIKDVGANAYRFSTSWSLVEPSPGQWNQEVLDYYVRLCDELTSNGVRPVITLHHYDDPIWFLQNYKGFETQEGIQAFVQYAEKIYDTLKDHGVHLWFTFNSPLAYAINGYVMGDRPPARKGRIDIARTVSWNMLEAHKRVYNALHAQYILHQDNPRVNKPAVGILKNIYQVDTWVVYQLGGLHIRSPLAKLVTRFTNWLKDQAFYDFFDQNKNCLDFVGLNYYSHGFTKSFKPLPDDLEIATDNPRNTISAEGLYRALHTLNEKIAQPHRVPIYITENGIAAGDKKDEMRKIFLKRYLYAMTRAIQDGVPVKGYFYWSLMDNYEWGDYNKQYGLYKVDRSLDEHGKPKLTRTLRDGAQPFIDASTSYRQGYDQAKTSGAPFFWLTPSPSAIQNDKSKVGNLRARL